MLNADGLIGGGLINGPIGGGGLTVPTNGGYYSVIVEGGNAVDEAITSGHEIFGHGIPSANGIFGMENNKNAIQTDNLFRSVMGITTLRDGSDHAGGVVPDPYAIPTFRDR